MGSLAKALQVKEVTIDGNPVTMSTDCISFLVSYLPNLQILSTMQVSEQVRRAAMAWRTTKEQSNSAFLDLSTQVCVNVRREEVITNAKTNWELLRSQTKCITSGASKIGAIKNDHIRGLHLKNSSQIDTVRLKGLDKAKSKAFGSLTSINENIESKKIHFKKRSNSSDNMFKTSTTERANALEFKLPPILLPIINNLTNNKTSEITQNSENRNSLSLIDGVVESLTESEVESSESHESLKSGLRNHLVKSSLQLERKNNERESEFDNLASNKILFTKIQKPYRNEDPQSSEAQSPIKHSLTRNSKSNNSYENQNSTAINKSPFQSPSSKTSSVESCKSVLSDSSSSSVPKILLDKSQEFESEKNRVRSAQMRKIVHYKSNRAATARAKHRALPPASPPPQPSPPKEREQGWLKKIKNLRVQLTKTKLNVKLFKFC